ncbi:MAG: hypothetical protein IPO21_17470 [Bacteroidales bacterium]|nr:hypothetical protein [Bacteroidales bacterium]
MKNCNTWHKWWVSHFTTEKEKMFDARPDSNKVGSIGQQAYSINHNDNSIVFSKYKIIRDVVGDKRTGNVAFSIVIQILKAIRHRHFINIE